MQSAAERGRGIQAPARSRLAPRACDDLGLQHPRLQHFSSRAGNAAVRVSGYHGVDFAADAAKMAGDPITRDWWDFTTLAKSLRDARGETGERCSSLGRRSNERGSDWLQDRSGGNFGFGRTPSLSWGSLYAHYPTLFCRSANGHYRPTGAYPVQSAMSASRRLQPAGERKYLSFLGGPARRE